LCSKGDPFTTGNSFSLLGFPAVTEQAPRCQFYLAIMIPDHHAHSRGTRTGDESSINVNLHHTRWRWNPFLLDLSSHFCWPSTPHQRTSFPLAIRLQSAMPILHKRVHVSCQKNNRTLHWDLLLGTQDTITLTPNSPKKHK
jgi:hypothetical protein